MRQVLKPVQVACLTLIAQALVPQAAGPQARTARSSFMDQTMMRIKASQKRWAMEL